MDDVGLCPDDVRVSDVLARSANEIEIDPKKQTAEEIGQNVGEEACGKDVELYSCDECYQAFSQKDLLRRHRSIHRHECSVCGRDYPSRAGLKIHLRIHSGEKPFECQECGKRFNQKGNLKTHMRKHTGETPYGCDFCSRRFTQLANKQTHERIHTGERPYVCVECGDDFRQLSSLQSHRTIHDPEYPPRKRQRASKSDVGRLIVKIAKPDSPRANVIVEQKQVIRFQCEHCGKEFRTRFALKRHQQDYPAVCPGMFALNSSSDQVSDEVAQ